MSVLLNLIGDLCVGAMIVAGGMLLLGYRLDVFARRVIAALRQDQGEA
jgi:hypothetical protein